MKAMTAMGPMTDATIATIAITATTVTTAKSRTVAKVTVTRDLMRATGTTTKPQPLPQLQRSQRSQ